MSHIKNLKFKLDEFEIDIPELILPDQGVTVIQGESGSGKTTLFNILIGLYQPEGWQWDFKGQKLNLLPVGERRLGVVFQSYDLFPHLSAAENILLVLKARHSKQNQQAMLEKLETYKQQLKLENCWSTTAQKLSGGEKQRVALLRAVVSNPRLLLLDEPFSALDSSLREESRKILKDFIQNLSIPVFLITHDQMDVDYFAQHVLQISRGRIVS